MKKQENQYYILKDGYNYLRVCRYTDYSVFVQETDENGKIINKELKEWKLQNKYLNTMVLPYLKRIVKSGSKLNKYIRIHFDKDLNYVSVAEQIISRRAGKIVWLDIMKDAEGIYGNSGNTFSYRPPNKNGITVATAPLETIFRIRAYYNLKRQPVWMKINKGSRKLSRKIADEFSIDRRWDEEFDAHIKELYLSQLPENDNDSDLELILRVLTDLQQLRESNFADKLDFGNLNQELTHVYGEKVIAQKLREEGGCGCM